MTILKTCRPCSKVADCDRRRVLLESLKGTGVITATHRCPEISPLFRPGQAVWVETFEMSFSEYAEYGEGPPEKFWYPGVFLRESSNTNTRGVVVIAAGALPEGGHEENEFRPISGRPFGVCKVIWKRIRPREAEDEPICRTCTNPYRVMGREYPNAPCPGREADAA